MLIDTEIDDGNQELAFGVDDSGVVVFDTESSDGDHEGIRIHTKTGARELARLLLLWTGADPAETPEARDWAETLVDRASQGWGIHHGHYKALVDAVAKALSQLQADASAARACAVPAATQGGEASEYASESVWAELRGLYEIAKKAWAVRTSESREAPGELDEALDFFANVALPAHLSRIVKPVPYPTAEAGKAQAEWVAGTGAELPNGTTGFVAWKTRRGCHAIAFSYRRDGGWGSREALSTDEDEPEWADDGDPDFAQKPIDIFGRRAITHYMPFALPPSPSAPEGT